MTYSIRRTAASLHSANHLQKSFVQIQASKANWFVQLSLEMATAATVVLSLFWLKLWRREKDSNPHSLPAHSVFRTGAIAILPSLHFKNLVSRAGIEPATLGPKPSMLPLHHPEKSRFNILQWSCAATKTISRSQRIVESHSKLVIHQKSAARTKALRESKGTCQRTARTTRRTFLKICASRKSLSFTRYTRN